MEDLDEKQLHHLFNCNDQWCKGYLDVYKDTMYGCVLWFQATLPEHAAEVPTAVKFLMGRISRLKTMHEEGVLSLWLVLDHYTIMFQPHRLECWMMWEDEHGCKLVMVLKGAVMAYFKVLFIHLAVDYAKS